MTPAVLVGLAVGDALGMPFEASGGKIHPALAAWDGSFQAGAHHKLPAGHWTDDTEMAIALAESLVAKQGFDPADVAARYLEWSKGTPHGMGGTTRKAMQALAEGKDWSESGVAGNDTMIGNGTAMRCAPLGVLFNGELQMETLEHCVQTDAIITHANIEAVSASLAVALTVDGCLRRRLNSRQILLTAGVASCQASGAAKPLTRVSCALDRAIILLGERTAPAQVASELGRHGGAAATVATALYCAALHADDFRAGVVAAVRSGGDTDTRAAIAGTILGATLGLEAIPEEYLAGLHRIEYLKDLDAKLYALRAQVTLDKR